MEVIYGVFIEVGRVLFIAAVVCGLGAAAWLAHKVWKDPRIED